MIGKRQIEQTIRRSMLTREASDAEALERLGYSAEGVEAVGYDLAEKMAGRRITARDAVAAAFAAGLEVGVRLERDRRPS